MSRVSLDEGGGNEVFWGCEGHKQESNTNCSPIVSEGRVRGDRAREEE